MAPIILEARLPLALALALAVGSAACGDRESAAPAAGTVRANPASPPVPDGRSEQNGGDQVASETPVLASLPAADGATDRVASVLSDPSTPPADAARTLLGMAGDPGGELGPEARLDALRAALPLLDEDGLAAAVDLAADGQTSEPLRSAVIDDLLARDPATGLPGLVRLAAALDDGPARAALRAELAAIVGEDYGTNWASWADAIDRRLEGLGVLPEESAEEDAPGSN